MVDLPSNVDIPPVNLMGAPSGGRARRQSSDDGTQIAITESQIVDGALRSQRENPERVVHQQDEQVIPNIAVDGDRLQGAERSSPVTRLPPEILTHIFELYVVHWGGLTLDGILPHGPFSLAQVCKLWRAVAESDPHLWGSIHIYFPESRRCRKEDVSRIGPAFDEHLKRSGTLPVELTFTDHRSYDPTTGDLISLLADRLRMHARRWRRISLQLSGAYFPLLLTFTPCDLSNLEHLCISGDVFTQAATLQLNLESAVRLKSFAYSGPGPSVDDSIYLRWENLAEVSFEFPPHHGTSYTLHRQFRHLAQCQNLTACSLGIDRNGLRIQGSRPVTLPCLRTLRVRRLSSSCHARGAVDLLILPQLQTLEIDASMLVGWNHRWHDRNFSGLLTRSGCSLLHLSIQDVYFPNDELMRCLALSPALTSLRFIPCPRSQDISDLIHRLDVSRTPTDWNQTQGNGRQRQVPGSTPLIPQLREIVLASSVEGYLYLMMAMLRSRGDLRVHGDCTAAGGVAPLRSAQVIFFNMWHDAGVDRVRNPGHESGRVASLRADLAQWVNENRSESLGGKEDEDELEASVVVDSPYLPEYIDVH